MNILTYGAHSGFEYEFAKTGHQFFSLEGAWDDYRRPRPDNWHLAGKPEGGFDLGVVLSGEGYDKLRTVPLPLVWYMIGDNGEGDVSDTEERISKFIFLGKEVADRWAVRDPGKKSVIELGVDPQEFEGYVGDGGDVLTVGWAIPERWEKGYMQLKAVDAQIPVTLVGKDNGALRCSVGTLPFEGLRKAYRRHKVYFNPGSIIGMSVVEAMMTGMPVVSFRPINLCDLIVHGENGFIVDTVCGARDRIRELIGDGALRLRIGAAARRTAIGRFGLALFVSKWNALFQGMK